jgi:hypothetical protein
VPDPVILELRFRPPENGSEWTPKDGETSDLERADVARQLNASIYNAARAISAEGDEHELTFFCACGCLAEVKRSLPDYVAHGAIVAGHARPRGVRRPSTR